MNSLKEAFSKQNLLKNLNFFGELNLGLVLTAVGIVYFKNPNHFAFGGTSGLSILLADLFPKINVGGFMWIINLVLVVLGGGIMGEPYILSQLERMTAPMVKPSFRGCRVVPAALGNNAGLMGAGYLAANIGSGWHPPRSGRTV